MAPHSDGTVLHEKQSSPHELGRASGRSEGYQWGYHAGHEQGMRGGFWGGLFLGTGLVMLLWVMVVATCGLR